MRVIVLTSDKYLDALQPFAWLFNKYWSPEQPVLVAGFTEPDFWSETMPENFTFHSIGEFVEYPVKRWSDAVIDLLDTIEDEAFVLMLEDYWLVRRVDIRAVRMLYDYALQFQYVARIDLTTDRLYAHGADLTYDTLEYLDLVKSMPGSPYHLSLMAGIWRRDALLAVLEEGESPWDLEIAGTTRLSHDQDALVLGTRQAPVRHTLAFRANNPGALLLDEINDDDVLALRELGYLEPWEDLE